MTKKYKDLKGRVWEGKDIPKWMFRTGPYTIETLPQNVVDLYNNLLELNPGYELFYFDDNDCEQFILEEWGQYYLDLYNKLIPPAYKSDLFRYLLIYNYGGCYGDFTQVMLVPYDTVIEHADRVFVRDDPGSLGYLYNAMMLCKPKDIVIKRAIEICVYNIENEVYGADPLCLTGPGVLGQAFKQVGLNRPNLAFPIKLGRYNKCKIFRNNWSATNTIDDGNVHIAYTRIQGHYNILYNEYNIGHVLPSKHYHKLHCERNVFVK